MKTNRTTKPSKTPVFVVRAAKNVKAQNRALGLPVIVWENGKVVEKPAWLAAMRWMKKLLDTLKMARSFIGRGEFRIRKVLHV